MNRAFSLVELSIVLVILGLLTGGVLAGKSLIRAAELRSVSTDIARYRTALYSFRDKYFALPGDMTNATSFWGDDSATCPDAAIANGTPGTCNGNGDGKIRYANNAEPARLWQQLAFSGMIEGSYSGLGGAPILPGSNIPRGKISNTGYLIYWAQADSSLSTNTADPNRLLFGIPTTLGGTVDGSALNSQEAWNIDTKLDDGLPSSGKLLGVGGRNNSGSCRLSAAAYDLTNSGISCFLLYTLD